MVRHHQYLFKVTQTSAYQDETGNWIQEGSDTIEYVGMCRYEPDGRGTMITIDEDRQVTLAGTIYMGLTDYRPDSGQILVVASDRMANTIIARKRVVNAEISRINTRIWVY